MRYTSDDFNVALSTLRNGGVILYPTDTIWGIGCDATNETAVRRVYDIKRRDDSKALILLLDSMEHLRKYVSLERLPSTLTGYLQPRDDEKPFAKPVTVIYPDVQNLPLSLLASDGSAAIRLTREEFSHNLCAALGSPLVSTSANISGKPAPQYFQQIDKKIISAVDYVCRYRQDDTALALPSTILRLSIAPKGDVAFSIIRQ
ncbi:MAG: Sua5/YciO/YrdC/YwlC family protein [Paludibacteraceae bacterium]|nr:Sua5/YciO/YrdC/YwlC family protein [Paludibacteraceae bacterium]